jgi:uncharacterized protein YjdB
MKQTVILCLIAGLTLNGCSKKDSEPVSEKVSVTGVSLSETSKNLTEGETFVLTATVAPANATDKTLTWTTSNATVASVSSGTVSALAAGETVITVTTVDGSKTATCTIRVQPATISVTGVSLNIADTTLKAGNTFVLTATVTPANASDKTLTWTSSKPEIASVSDGTVSAIATGEAVITVTTVDGSKTATCTVTVKPTLDDILDWLYGDDEAKKIEAIKIVDFEDFCDSSDDFLRIMLADSDGVFIRTFFERDDIVDCLKQFDTHSLGSLKAQINASSLTDEEKTNFSQMIDNI